VLEIADKENLTVAEKPLRIADLLGAEEVFLTNVIMQVLPVIAVEAHTVGNGKPGKITRQLMQFYQDVLEKE
jgi:D-alanine transaminase